MRCFFVFVSNCFQNINVPLQCKADEDLLSNIVDDTIITDVRFHFSNFSRALFKLGMMSYVVLTTQSQVH